MDVNGLSDFKLTDLDWELLQGIGAVLEVSFHPDPYGTSSMRFQVPHGVQQAMSAESMPVLSSTVAIFELFMTQWEELGQNFPKLRPWINIGLKWARRYYNLMDDTDAYIVTMSEFFIHISMN